MMARCLCAIFGHHDELRLGPGALWTRCEACGRETAGITLGPPRYHQTQRRKGNAMQQRRRLARIWLAHRLDGAA